MGDGFAQLLTVGGKSNSLGEVNLVIAAVLDDRSRLDELYGCLFDTDAWVRMRAADAVEKVCRQHPDWLLPYVARFPDELASSTQPSIRWHLAQIYRQVELTSEQRAFATRWLERLLSDREVDWIVAANAMATLAHFTREGHFPAAEMIRLLRLQKQHKSPAVVKRADKLLAEFVSTAE
jgi:hypothetical protein